jgi:hypothetical protein
MRTDTDPFAGKTRFDLEQAIQTAWLTRDDLNMFISAKFDTGMTEDQEANVLVGLAQIHDIRMQKVWDIMEHLVKIGALK